MGLRSTFDREAGQSLLKFLHSSAGYLGASQVKARKVGNALEVPKAGVRDLSIAL